MKKLTLLLLAGGVAGLAQANGVLYYGGDHDGIDALSSERNTMIAGSMTYDNFVVDGPGWRIDSVFAHFMSDLSSVQGIEWEIRSQVASGDGGNLVAQGSGDGSWTWTGNEWFGLNEYRAEIGVAGLELAAGEYWLGVRVVGNGGGRAYLATTDGGNGFGPLHDGRSYFDSPFFGIDFMPVSDLLGTDYDFSVGVVGDVVPEPASMLALSGALGLLAARRRRKA